jgi:hypothetical protein
MPPQKPTTVGEARAKIAEIQSWLETLSVHLSKESETDILEDHDYLQPADFAVLKSIGLGRGC